MAISFHLKRAMEARKVSGYALARETGMTASAIYKLRKKKPAELRMTTLDALCRALDCDVGELLEYKRR